MSNGQNQQQEPLLPVPDADRVDELREAIATLAPYLDDLYYAAEAKGEESPIPSRTIATIRRVLVDELALELELAAIAHSRGLV